MILQYSLCRAAYSPGVTVMTQWSQRLSLHPLLQTLSLSHTHSYIMYLPKIRVIYLRILHIDLVHFDTLVCVYIHTRANGSHHNIKQSRYKNGIFK